MVHDHFTFVSFDTVYCLFVMTLKLLNLLCPAPTFGDLIRKFLGCLLTTKPVQGHFIWCIHCFEEYGTIVLLNRENTAIQFKIYPFHLHKTVKMHEDESKLTENQYLIYVVERKRSVYLNNSYSKMSDTRH